MSGNDVDFDHSLLSRNGGQNYNGGLKYYDDKLILSLCKHHYKKSIEEKTICEDNKESISCDDDDKQGDEEHLPPYLIDVA